MANLLPQNLFGVAGRTIAITGGGSGIGRMLAKGFSVNGCNTILIDINEQLLVESKKESEEAAKSVGIQQAIVHTMVADLSNKEGVQQVVEKFLATTEALDVIIHCAAYRHMNPITYTTGQSLDSLQKATASTSWESWDHAFQLNVLAPYFLTAGLINLLGTAAKKGDGSGSVILFSSPASVHNHQFVPTYQTSKAAVDHLTRILAMEFADFYIRVNAISPGLVPSGMSDVNDPTSNIHLAKETPARRAGGEEDMVGTAVWLSSRAGSYMDGKVVRVDGGRLLILKGVLSNGD